MLTSDYRGLAIFRIGLVARSLVLVVGYLLVLLTGLGLHRSSVHGLVWLAVAGGGALSDLVLVYGLARHVRSVWSARSARTPGEAARRARSVCRAGSIAGLILVGLTTLADLGSLVALLRLAPRPLVYSHEVMAWITLLNGVAHVAGLLGLLALLAHLGRLTRPSGLPGPPRIVALLLGLLLLLVLALRLILVARLPASGALILGLGAAALVLAPFTLAGYLRFVGRVLRR